MTQKTKRLQRWLDRLTAACDSRRWGSAVAEADCLSAELKQVREELWKEAEKETVRTPFSVRAGGAVFCGARSVAIALLIICLTTIPIAVESGKPAPSAQRAFSSVPAGRGGEFAIVTTEEKELITMLRKSLNDSNIAVRASEVRPHTPKKAAVTAVKAAVREVPAAAPVMQAQKPVKPQKQENTIKTEELLTLIQIGEKSLRGGEPAIRIIN